MRRLRTSAGVTLVEIMMAVAIMSIVGLAFAGISKMFAKTVMDVELVTRSVLGSQALFVYLERDLYMANEVTHAGPTKIEFIMDITERPDFPSTGLDRDDPDMDGDGVFNLVDDDEDSTDGKIDYMVRYELVDDRVERRVRINEGAWSEPRQIAREGVVVFDFSYLGSKSNIFNANLDNGEDGLPNSGDVAAGENDGIVTAAEIDMTQAPDGAGNQTFLADPDAAILLDTDAERKFISAIRIRVEFDQRQGEGRDFALETEILPPMLELKPVQLAG